MPHNAKKPNKISANCQIKHPFTGDLSLVGGCVGQTSAIKGNHTARMVRAKGALAQGDRKDALAMAIAYWERQAARDMERAKQERYDAQLDVELAKFMEHALGGETA
jgi:hypothetical protein